MNITALPPHDPIFALAPELKLHLFEFDGALVVNSREVARVFGRRHRLLLRNIMEDACGGEKTRSGDRHQSAHGGVQKILWSSALFHG